MAQGYDRVALLLLGVPTHRFRARTAPCLPLPSRRVLLIPNGRAKRLGPVPSGHNA
ncbi:MAG: hypothetical protein AVDCRST_MAG88-1374 [uncultured Thermomicrobiales bacterium]|uniref:Uncharacterized protein n=1 Tax=uncultured Thermomicrobiales bacterium TaxID=1645740 RepID=A0A6J4UY98_9BACT|nr:MAG: hypothetical protein AVDCRST_MAG88-1374 [uncultured Thermomicrobiales bacterium]